MSHVKIPAPVRCAADALRVFFLGTTNPLQAETLAFVLDNHGQGGVITIVSGTVDADSVLPVTECMARAAERVDRATALVVASVRPGGCVLARRPRSLDGSQHAGGGLRNHLDRVVHHHRVRRAMPARLARRARALEAAAYVPSTSGPTLRSAQP